MKEKKGGKKEEISASEIKDIFSVILFLFGLMREK